MAANETAVAVVNDERQKKGEPLSTCGHYNFWLMYGYLQQGRENDAKRVLNECRATVLREGASQSKHPMAGMLDPDNSHLGSFVQMWTRFLLDTEDWKSEVADWSVPVEKQTAARLTYEFMTGFAAIRRGEVEEAEKAWDRVKEAHAQLGTDLQKENNPDRSYQKRVEILEQQLNAMILMVKGKKEEAVDLLKLTAAAEESLPFAFGPPFVDKPSRELLGEALLQLDRPKEAVAAFEAALTRAPLRTLSLLGLARAAERSSDQIKSEETYGRLRKIWQHTDRLPPEMKNQP